MNILPFDKEQLKKEQIHSTITLLPHQEIVRNHLYKSHKDKKTGFLNGSRVGSGKTISSLLFLWELKKEYDKEYDKEYKKEKKKEYEKEKRKKNFSSLILVPLSVLNYWQDEYVKKLGLPQKDIQIYHGSQRKKYNPNCPITLCTIGMLQLLYKLEKKDIKEENENKKDKEDDEENKKDKDKKENILNKHYNIIVIDESQRFGNIDCEEENKENKENKNLINLSPLYSALLKRLSRDFTLLLSGTPLPNSLNNIRSLLTLINVPLFPSLNNNKEELLKVYKEYSFRASLKDMPPQSFPITFYQTIKLPMINTSMQLEKMKELSSLKRQLYHHSITSLEIYSSLKASINKLTCELRLLACSGVSKKEEVQACSSESILACPKMAYILQMLSFIFQKERENKEEKEEKDEKRGNKEEMKRIIIVSSFVCLLECLEKVLLLQGYSPLVYTGEVSLKKRETIKNQFLSSSNSILLLSKKSGGVGLSLEAKHMIILDPDFSFSTEAQCIGRIQRWGQSHSIYITLLITEKSIDEVLRQIQINKLLLSSAFIEEDEDILKQVYTVKEIEHAKTSQLYYNSSLLKTSFFIEENASLKDQIKRREKHSNKNRKPIKTARPKLGERTQRQERLKKELEKKKKDRQDWLKDKLMNRFIKDNENRKEIKKEKKYQRPRHLILRK